MGKVGALFLSGKCPSIQLTKKNYRTFGLERTAESVLSSPSSYREQPPVPRKK